MNKYQEESHENQMMPPKGTRPFTAGGEITVDPKGVIKLLNNLNVQRAPGSDDPRARASKASSPEIDPIH